MYSDIPNLASGVRLHQRLVDAEGRSHLRLRLPPLNYMEAARLRQCTPRNRDPTIERLPPVDFTSGYFQRAMDKLPRQGSRKPWRIYQNYVQDLIALRLAPMDDGVLEFAARPISRDTQGGAGAARSTQNATTS